MSLKTCYDIIFFEIRNFLFVLTSYDTISCFTCFKTMLSYLIHYYMPAIDDFIFSLLDNVGASDDAPINLVIFIASL